MNQFEIKPLIQSLTKQLLNQRFYKITLNIAKSKILMQLWMAYSQNFKI